MARPISETGTKYQRLSELVEWYLSDRKVEVKFKPNPQMSGKIVPEFDFVYFLNGRRITERALAMQVMCELFRLDYAYSLSQVMSSVTEQAWRYYLENMEYPEWLARAGQPNPLKRPVGRPRRRPSPIKMPKHSAIEDMPPREIEGMLFRQAEAVNTPEDTPHGTGHD